MPALCADTYPESYIRHQLHSAINSIRVDVAKLKPGQLMAVEYVGRSVWIYRRTQNDIHYLETTDKSRLADPDSKNVIPSIEAAYGSSSSYVWARLLLADQPAIERTRFRSLKKNVFVVGGWSPESGCVLGFKVSEKNVASFYDPCTGARFDDAGRILAKYDGDRPNSDAGIYNLYIPPYTFKNGHVLLIGLKPAQKLPELDFPKDRCYSGRTPTERLITAARYNNLEKVEAALKDGAKADYYQVGRGSPLDAAIIGSSLKIVKLLIAHGAKPTPNSLRAAKIVGREDVIRIIERMQR